MLTLSYIITILQQHKKTLHDRYKVQRVGVFGSYVRGDMHRGSDVDVLVEFFEPVSLLALVSLENYLSEILGVKADVVPREDIRVELKDRIIRETVFA
ncbi:MAG: Nucleotidyltransferase domain protein [Euryarchaeota archaeon ADurb.BinA087]|nr:MAG: Nucleotidyltransferase domain protein [Euryarchaeota archaeon ADurb.BinA087]HNQ26268.1 nucleotidyltransferase family protein [Methanoregulaceae archaeon]HQA81601.1 nucleotidyltransferase family protein [Methanoregulaceae archaeon]